MQVKRWDIFCKIIDNFGDIGVCWRLAKQLYDVHGFQLRLYVDDLSAAKAILTDVDINKESQQYQGVTIVHWYENMVFNDVADVVIETFSCGLPAQYQHQMHANTMWVNVDYLSAEPWVEEFHLKSSKINNSGLIRYFYFPGFNEATGGLLRDADLAAKRNSFCKDDNAINAFLDKLAIPAKSGLTVSMFCYANAPLEALFKAVASGSHDVTILIPYELHVQSLACFFNQDNLRQGDILKFGKLTVQILPFLTQDDYDQLLWICDINFVRGEDSWVRAVWAGKPFIWQPYYQTDNTHMVKLGAFLELFYGGSVANESVVKLQRSWVEGELPVLAWQDYISHLSKLSTSMLQRSNALVNQASLVDRLVAFVRKEQ